jgi:hypothetical protein
MFLAKYHSSACNKTAFAAIAPSASGRSTEGSLRLEQAKVNVRVVEEMRPPSSPVTK